MKRIIALFCLLCLTVVGVYAIDRKPFEKRLCDSVFKLVSHMPLDTTRIIYLRNIYRSQKSEDWTLELLYGALSLSRKFESHKLELDVLSDIYDYYGYRENLEIMTRYCLPTLKEASYRHKDYGLYFLAWSDLLNIESERGNIATVHIQAEIMRQEADSLNYLEGRIVADMVIGGALWKSNQYEESIKANLKILESPLVTHSQKRIIYQRLSSSYQQQGQYEEALTCQDKALHALRQAKDVDSEAIRRHTISIEMGYCSLLQEMADTKGLRAHLDVLSQFYNDDLELGNRISYHTYWASYFYLTENKTDAYTQYDRAIEMGRDHKNTFMIAIHEMKAQCAMHFGDLDVAAQSYKAAVQLCYTFNRDIARKNREAVEANFRIRKALLDHADNARHINSLKVAMSALLLLALAVVLWRILRTNRLLSRSAKDIREALKLVDASNKMKEIFLRNINEEIKEPIDTVIKCSIILSSDQALAHEDRLKYSEEIKKHAGYLILLVNNVLDLSRLEAGMMKFNVQENDLVLLCADVKMMLDMQEANRWKQTFSTQLDSLMVQVDSSWLCRVLGFLLSSPEGNHEVQEQEVTYVLTAEEGFARIIINTSPIKWQACNSNDRISHDIARLYFETFGGTYAAGEKTIEITYPILKI